jgi:ABC-2 type transport system ATP-binding protein
LRVLAIEADHLHRVFSPRRGLLRKGTELVAVEDVSLAVEPGIVFGLLGPNGAGKTTTIKMLSTLLIPSSGSAMVAGFDVATQEREVRRRLGVVLGGDRGLYGKLTARANLEYFAHLYGLPRDTIGRRAEELLELVNLAHRADDRVEGFSRGMKQRLHLAKALVHDPPVVFLDEPTIGLDPAAAVNLREIVKRLVPEHTVLLTTHYLHEADELCERIAIIDQGRIVVEDSPAGIKQRVGGGRRHIIRVRGHVNGAVTGALLSHSTVSAAVAEPVNGLTAITVPAGEDAAVIDDALRLLLGQGLTVESVETADLTLEDAFLAITGAGD